MQVKYRNFAFYRLLFSITLVGMASFSSSLDLPSASASIISSHVITELLLILAKYLPFWQQQKAEFQIKSFSHI